MTEAKAGFQYDGFVQPMYNVTFETRVTIAMIVLILGNEKLILATIVRINATVFGIFQFSVQIPCVLGTHTVTSKISVNVAYKRSIWRMTVFELAINPVSQIPLLTWQYE